MKHVWALIVKFLMFFVVISVIQGLVFGWPFATLLLTSVLMTGVAYIVGDLWILPITTNLTATSADFVLSFIGIWVIGSLLLNIPVLTTGPLISALLIAVGEWLYHNLVMSKILRLIQKGESPA